MHDDLPFQGKFLRNNVGIKISRQQGNLKENCACVPYIRRSAHFGKQNIRYHRLDKENQKGAGEYGDVENGKHKKTPEKNLCTG